MATRISIDAVTDELIESFVQLSSTYYQDEPANDRSVVRWRHLETPTGSSTAVELVDGSERVGRMWIQIHPWSVRSLAVRAANPIDFLIREDHRRLPAFLSLFKATMKEAEQRSDVVFHTSNPLTDDLYRKLMKLEPVTELDGAVLPIRPCAAAEAAGVFRTALVGRVADAVFAAAVRGLGPVGRLLGVRLAAAPEQQQADAVVTAFRSEEPICGARSAEQRSWRFRGAGAMTYQEKWLYRGGRPIGYIVTTDRDVDGVRGRFVVDLVLPGSQPRRIVWSMWLQIAAGAAREDRHAIFFFYNRQNRRLARLAAFPMVTVSRDRLPQRVPVFVRESKASTVTIPAVEWGTGYYVLSDFDMF